MADAHGTRALKFVSNFMFAKVAEMDGLVVVFPQCRGCQKIIFRLAGVPFEHRNCWRVFNDFIELVPFFQTVLKIGVREFLSTFNSWLICTRSTQTSEGYLLEVFQSIVARVSDHYTVSKSDTCVLAVAMASLFDCEI